MAKWSDNDYDIEMDVMNTEIVEQPKVNGNNADISWKIKSLIEQFTELKMNSDSVAAVTGVNSNMLQVEKAEANCNSDPLFVDINKLKQRVRELRFNILDSLLANQCKQFLEVKMLLKSGQNAGELNQKVTILIQMDKMRWDILQQFSDVYNSPHDRVKRVTFSEKFEVTNADNTKSSKKLKELQKKEAAEEKAHWWQLKQQ